MDWIRALGTEYGCRVKMFTAFVEAFEKTGPTMFPSLAIEESTDDAVTFRYLGRRLRIRHSFAVEDHPEVFESYNSQSPKLGRLTRPTPGETADTVRSELKLVKAGKDPDNDLDLPASIFVGSEGRVIPTEGPPTAWTIVDRPEFAFQELLAVWLGPKKTDPPK